MSENRYTIYFEVEPIHFADSGRRSELAYGETETAAMEAFYSLDHEHTLIKEITRATTLHYDPWESAD